MSSGGAETESQPLTSSRYPQDGADDDLIGATKWESTSPHTLDIGAARRSPFATISTASFPGCIPSTSVRPRQPTANFTNLAIDASENCRGFQNVFSSEIKPANDDEEEGDAAAVFITSRQQRASFGNDESNARIPQLDGVNDGRKHAQHPAGSSSSYQVMRCERGFPIFFA